MNRRVGATIVLGWALLYSRGGKDWRKIDEFPYQATCDQVMENRVGQEALEEIGSALSSQPADNPLRQDAFRRAVPRVRDRYRCERQA
jgi:hypothetical protein